MGEDGFMEEAPSALTDDVGDDDYDELDFDERAMRSGWYRAPIGARCCDRLCFKKDFAAKELELWWASKDAAALRPRRVMRQGKRFTRELAEVNRKRAVAVRRAWAASVWLRRAAACNGVHPSSAVALFTSMPS